MAISRVGVVGRHPEQISVVCCQRCGPILGAVSAGIGHDRRSNALASTAPKSVSPGARARGAGRVVQPSGVARRSRAGRQDGPSFVMASGRSVRRARSSDGPLFDAARRRENCCPRAALACCSTSPSRRTAIMLPRCSPAVLVAVPTVDGGHRQARGSGPDLPGDSALGPLASDSKRGIQRGERTRTYSTSHVFTVGYESTAQEALEARRPSVVPEAVEPAVALQGA